MGYISEADKTRLRGLYERQFKDDVKILFFTMEYECPICSTIRELLEEVSGLSSKIKLEVYDFVKDSEKAKLYGIDRVPAIAVVGRKDYGIRIYGLPYGYEFKPFTEMILDVSRGVTDLSPENRKVIGSIAKETHIQVFVLLTCPYCPMVTRSAFKFAIENPHIKVDMTDIQIFPNLGTKYHVEGTPKTVINEKTDFSGGITEDLFAQQLAAIQRTPTYYG
ncbi:MAG: thioredoxin family protein [Candidatus Freyarchaeum deiterrae]